MVYVIRSNRITNGLSRMLKRVICWVPPHIAAMIDVEEAEVTDEEENEVCDNYVSNIHDTDETEEYYLLDKQTVQMLVLEI